MIGYFVGYVQTDIYSFAVEASRFVSKENKPLPSNLKEKKKKKSAINGHFKIKLMIFFFIYIMLFILFR